MSASILVYDHSAVILDRFWIHLRNAGYQVTIRFPRDMTVEDVRRFSPDLLVVAATREVIVPITQRLRVIRDDPTTVQIPAVFATPAHEDIAPNLDDLGVRHVKFVIEPFNIDEVLKTIPELLPESGE